RPVVPDWQRKSYGEENTFERDLRLDSLDLKRTLIAHAEALGRRLRADKVRARTVTLKLKLARPLGEGRFPVITRSCSLERTTDDGAEIAAAAARLLSRVREKEKVRLAGIHAHNLERPDLAQLGLFEPEPIAEESRRVRLNRALDEVTRRFGEEALTRGIARVSRA